MLVLPGGAYSWLAGAYEGADVAAWLGDALGLPAFVLSYRLGSAGYRQAAIEGDARRAVRLPRVEK